MIGALRNHRGQFLDHTFTDTTGDDPRIAVVLHGVTSHKERPWMTSLCDRLGTVGIRSLRFTFAGNQGSEGDFTDATISAQVAELGAVLDQLEREFAPAPLRAICIGHSMGAATATLRAARDPRITALVSLAGMVHVAAFMQRTFGHLPFGAAMLGKPHCPWNRALAADAEQIGDTLTAASTITVPWLLVHGTADELVPITDSHDARQANAEHAKVVELQGADHRFSGHESAMADAVLRWLTLCDRIA